MSVVHGEEPWPVLPPEASPSPGGSEPPTVPAGEPPDGIAAGGRSAAKVALLLGALAAVTVGGIALGKALTPKATLAVTTTVTKPPPARKPKPRSVPWGPFRAKAVGKLPAGGAQVAAALRGTKLVVVGGPGDTAVLVGAPAGKLEQVASLSTPHAAAAVFLAGKAIWIVGGERGTVPTDAITKVDLVSGKVKSAGVFEEPLAEAGVVARSGSIYLVGGWTGTKFATAILKFSPPDTVSLLGRLPEGLRSPAVALIGHTIFIAGGQTATGPSRGLYAIDTRSGKLVFLGNLPRAVDGAILVPSARTLYLLGGRAASRKAVESIVKIVPATGRFTLAGDLPFALAGATAVPDGTKTFVVAPATGIVYRLVGA